MLSSEWKWNMLDVWWAMKRLLHVLLSTAERDELQEHANGGHYGINSRTRHGAGPGTGLQMRVNEGWHGTENSDAKEMCELKARSAVQEKEIERLEGKLAEQIQLLQEVLAKLTSIERATSQQTAQETQVIGRLEEKVLKLDRDLQERTAVLQSVADSRDARKANRTQRPEANADQGPQEKISKLSGAEGRQNSPLTPNPLSSEGAASKRDQKIHDSSANLELRHTMEGKRTNKPLPWVPRAHSISVADVAELVRVLNAQLEQTSCLIEDSLSYRQSPISGRRSEVVSNELLDYLGLWLCRFLRRKPSEPDTKHDPLMTRIVLQTGLVNVCSRIINGRTPQDIGQGVADTRARSRSRTDAKSNNHEKYLTSILRELINAVGGSLQSDDQLPPLYREEVKGIASQAVALHRIINEEAAPLKLVTYTIPCGTEFDSSRMGDTEWDGGETAHDRVICTMEMGLQCREEVEPGKSRQEYGVTMKAKVVLAGTLEAQGS